MRLLLHCLGLRCVLVSDVHLSSLVLQRIKACVRGRNALRRSSTVARAAQRRYLLWRLELLLLLLSSLGRLLHAVDRVDILQQLIGDLHGHLTEIRDQMSTIGVTGDVAFRAFPRVLPA